MPSYRVSSFVSTAAVLLPFLALCSASRAGAQTLIFEDHFDSRNTLAWSVTVGDPTLTTPDPFRYSDLDLRDPHLFINVPVFGCSDFTDMALPLGLAPSFNDQLETALTTDSDSDGRLDATFALLMRPFNRNAVNIRQDYGSLPCTAPLATTTCDVDRTNPPRATPYNGLMAGSCLAALAGTTSGYVPAVSGTIAPCFVTVAAAETLDLGGIPLPLVDVQLAASFGADPVNLLTSGLMRGFLSEATADATTLPAALPIVGGQPLSILLRGGTGNCAAGDDRDTHMGISGWWFYFAWEAERVPYTGP